MSDFVLNYGILEEIAKTSDLLSRQADEYADQLTGRIANALSNVTGSSSGYLEDASYYVNAKIEQLRKNPESSQILQHRLIHWQKWHLGWMKRWESFWQRARRNFYLIMSRYGLITGRQEFSTGL